ncbi:hypothetical protein RHSP_04799 [Rhizobium freirei PRF 81]|uniref:DUF3800 domain-containing protein n=1 Tax=Rhizobium freirei PRF 81 TaxID=363754 RepID=N6UEA6_9HYPH|nr:DUF3800 domain-containing protein [Rhizobium freirei]ENN88493.1 hypothetical protein RHSP_04799 [Rhizobium freirei PRF 81]
MAVRTLYFDESGFTKYNLLDPSQPIFAIASADIVEGQAREILLDSFPRYRGAEFKFSNIWGSNSRAGLLRFAAHLESLQDLAFIYMADKRFTVLTKIVDFLIEPYVTDGGYDFYADGFCWKYANYIHFGLTQFAPPELLDALLRHYQTFNRNPTPDGLATLQVRLSMMAATTEDRVKIFLEQMALGAALFERYHSLENFHGSDEFQTTTMLAIVSHWRQHYPEDFAVIHDDSSNFLRSREMWGKITSVNVPPQLHRSGDGSFVEYPLRVISTTAMDSKDSPSIQFCDLLAGLAAKHFSPRTEGDDRVFMDQVIEAGLKHITYNGIRPDVIFTDRIPPRRLDGPDVVDQMTDVIFGSHSQNS